MRPVGHMRPVGRRLDAPALACDLSFFKLEFKMILKENVFVYE